MNLINFTNTALFRLYVEEGSREAINIFFQNQMDLFYRVAFKYTKNAADAEDVLQAAFISIMETAHQYKGIHTDEEKLLLSWCLSVVVHCSLMKIRTDSNRRNRENNYSTANINPIYEENNMESHSENLEIHKKVQDAIFQLPEKYRIPIHLKYVEGFELDAIASILKLNANTLRSLIKRGLDKVSTQLKEDNVTLSSVGLIGLIQALPVEKAPFDYQTLASKIIGKVKGAQDMTIHISGNSALFSTKLVAIISAIGIVLFAGIYYFRPINNSPPKPTNLLSEKVTSYTNQTWDFFKENDRNLKLYAGQWAWSEESKGMVSELNSTILISLPIAKQEKTIELEFELIANNSKESIDGIHFNAFWVKNNHILHHDYYVSKNKYNIGLGVFVKNFKIYYYNGYLCQFINGKCYQLSNYTKGIDGANLTIASKNFIFQKISSHTLDVPPEELLKAIKDSSNQTPVLHEELDISLSKQPSN